MALKIRFRQQGRNNRPFYRLVLAEARTKRDGKYMENLGWYNPFEEGENTLVKADRVKYWLDQGAEISERAETILKKVAPEVVAFYRQKREVKRLKETVARRNRGKASAA